MRKFVPYHIIYTCIFYLENLVQGKAAFGWNKCKTFWKLFEKYEMTLWQRAPQVSHPSPLLRRVNVASGTTACKATALLEPFSIPLGYKSPTPPPPSFNFSPPPGSHAALLFSTSVMPASSAPPPPFLPFGLSFVELDITTPLPWPPLPRGAAALSAGALAGGAVRAGQAAGESGPSHWARPRTSRTATAGPVCRPKSAQRLESFMFFVYPFPNSLKYQKLAPTSQICRNWYKTPKNSK
jgi:hypothetical protein